MRFGLWRSVLWVSRHLQSSSFSFTSVYMDLQFGSSICSLLDFNYNPYFCVVEYTRTANERSRVRLKTESETGAKKLKIPDFLLVRVDLWRRTGASCFDKSDFENRLFWGLAVYSHPLAALRLRLQHSNINTTTISKKSGERTSHSTWRKMRQRTSQIINIQ